MRVSFHSSKDDSFENFLEESFTNEREDGKLERKYGKLSKLERTGE